MMFTKKQAQASFELDESVNILLNYFTFILKKIL